MLRQITRPRAPMASEAASEMWLQNNVVDGSTVNASTNVSSTTVSSTGNRSTTVSHTTVSHPITLLPNRQWVIVVGTHASCDLLAQEFPDWTVLMVDAEKGRHRCVLNHLVQRPANPGPRAKFGPRTSFNWPAWACFQH